MTEEKLKNHHQDHRWPPKTNPLNTMETGRPDRDSDLGEDSPVSRVEDHSDREDGMKDCDSSDEGVNVNSHMNGTNGVDYQRSPTHVTGSSHLNRQPPFSVNPLEMLGSFMGVQNLPNMQHGDVIEKLKMQVREINGGSMEQNFSLHPFNALHAPPNTTFPLPSSSSNHSQPQNLSQQSQNGFSFPPPSAQNTKEANPASNSSTSSEASNSPTQNSGWNFEEQYKQVRQLYDIDQDPRRKEFLDELFVFMQRRGTPINRLPIMAKSVLDLFALYNLVTGRGGLVDVINKKLWQEIIKGLNLPSSITSAAFTLRTQYMKYLYPYECDKLHMSTTDELQAAIDGNKREGRRQTYGGLCDPLQLRSQSSMSQVAPMALANAAATANAHRFGTPAPIAHMPTTVDIERMFEAIKSIQNIQVPTPEMLIQQREQMEFTRAAIWTQICNANTSPPAVAHTASPLISEPPQREALNLSNTSPPAVLHTASPLINEPPQIEALNLSESPPSNIPTRDRDLSNNGTDRDTQQRRRMRQIERSNFYNRPSTSNDDRSRTPVNNNETPEPAHFPRPVYNGNGSNSTVTSGQMLSGMQFKISSRGSGTNGEQQLSVSMELNGVHFEGVLFATPTTSSAANATVNSSQSSSNATPVSSVDDRSSRGSRPLMSS